MSSLKDFFNQCFQDAKAQEPQITAQKVEEIFCAVCKNRQCGRAGWASSSWDKRISTQVDRLLINPNIAIASDSSRWEGISNFEGFEEPNTIEVWGASTPPPATPTIITPPTPSIVLIDQSKPVEKPSPKPFNTAPKEIYIGGGGSVVQSSTGNIKQNSDPWSVPPPSIKVGGTFKMGG